MSPMPQTFGQAAYHPPGVYGQTSTPVIQDFSQSLSSMPPSFGQMTSQLTDIHRTSSPVPQGLSGRIISPIPQHTGQITSHFPHQGFRMWSPLPEKYVITPFDASGTAIRHRRVISRTRVRWLQAHFGPLKLLEGIGGRHEV